MLRQFSWLTAVLLATWLTATAATVIASDWPRFRGPNGTGVSTDSGVPLELGDSQNLAWKIELPGIGHSSPIVSKQRVFLQTASMDGNARSLLCLDLIDGKPLWSQPAPGTPAHTHPKNTLASCTAAADGERVFMPFWDGSSLSIAAYDYDGKHLWSRELGTFTGEHGPGHSPIIVGDRIILANDQDGSSELVALKAATGDIAWRVQRPAHRCCYSTPVLLERPGAAPEVLVGSTFGITAYSPTDGAEKW